ncbi:MAG TPA: PA0069 family radical SAM protein [Methylovorus sp.]|jgi:DNA repair photolyase|nr:PA0069 family radical SAM protein [Methylovorus sp.]
MTDKPSPGDPFPDEEHQLPARPLIFKGRGSASNQSGRFEQLQREAFDDGWAQQEADTAPRLITEIIHDSSRSILFYNESPDIPFDRSINPYRGCEHGCIYCYARPSHTYLGLSAGLDFESRILVKPDAAALLRQALAKPGYACQPIAMGTNTDPYQPLERDQRITRQIIEVLAEHRHPLTIVTKSAMVERDIDLLAPMAADNLARVFISITTLDRHLSRIMEPRAAAPQRRLRTLQRLAQAGIPCGVMTAPMIPALNDAEMEQILEEAHAAGARYAGYVLLRLPLEVAPLFEEWLQQHFPLKAAHVMSIIRQSRGGKAYDAQFHQRMRGQGIFADLLAQRFRLAASRLGFMQERSPLNTRLFRPPVATPARSASKPTPQRDLFE